MRHLIILFIGSILVVGISCKKCQTCTIDTPGLTENFTFANGDVITVNSGDANYNGTVYYQGDQFTIVFNEDDTTLLNNGLQFYGSAKVTRTLHDTICGTGKSYDDMIDQHLNNGWYCSKYKKGKD